MVPALSGKGIQELLLQVNAGENLRKILAILGGKARCKIRS